MRRALTEDGTMAKDLEKFERIALEKAGALGGRYLEGIGKTDMSVLTEEEWNGLGLADSMATTCSMMRMCVFYR